MTKGRPTRYKYPWPDRDGELQGLRRQGMSNGEIGRRMGLSYYAIIERCACLPHPRTHIAVGDECRYRRNPKVTLPPLAALKEPLYIIPVLQYEDDDV